MKNMDISGWGILMVICFLTFIFGKIGLAANAVIGLIFLYSAYLIIVPFFCLKEGGILLHIIFSIVFAGVEFVIFKYILGGWYTEGIDLFDSFFYIIQFGIAAWLYTILLSVATAIVNESSYAIWWEEKS